MKEPEVRYYDSFTDDFDKSTKQDFSLPKDYKWVRNDIFSKALSGVIYFLALVFGHFYCRYILHMRIRGKRAAKPYKDGFFIFGNHTQPIGDVVIPAFAVLPKRIFTIVSPANYGIPIIGRALPYLGALPVTDNLSGIKELNRAIETRLAGGHPIVVYPEAHVWEYYTGIRPFPDTAFKYPVKFDRPAFVLTNTYRKSKVFKRPIMYTYLDGPFFPTGETSKQKAANLKETVYKTMRERAESSNFDYIKYEKK